MDEWTRKGRIREARHHLVAEAANYTQKLFRDYGGVSQVTTDELDKAARALVKELDRPETCGACGQDVPEPAPTTINYTLGGRGSGAHMQPAAGAAGGVSGYVTVVGGGGNGGSAHATGTGSYAVGGNGGSNAGGGGGTH